jgi:hypothetical protein
MSSRLRLRKWHVRSQMEILRQMLNRVIPAFLMGCVRRTYATIFQFLGGCYAANAHVRAVVVVSPEPLCGEILSLPLAGR